MYSASSELQTLRGRVFFWIGLLILPVFWVWWMRPEHFSRRQRAAGWVWTACFVAGLIAGRHLVGQRLALLIFSYDTVAIELGVVLWIWLLLRIFSIGRLVMLYLVSVDVIASLASLWIPVLGRMGPSPLFLIFPVVPAVWHLLLEPYRRWRREIDVEKVHEVQNWIRLVLICCILVLGCALFANYVRR